MASQQVITLDRSRRPRHQHARAVPDGEIAGAVANGSVWWFRRVTVPDREEERSGTH